MKEDMSEITGLGLTEPDKMYLEERGKQQAQEQENNPFESPQYQNVGVPDTPVQYGGGMADILLSDNEVPEVIRKKFWYVFNKDNVLTFLDDAKKQEKMVSFDISVIDAMNSMESFDDYTFATDMQNGLIRGALDVKLDRAVGMKGSASKNERTIMQSQFQESRAINENAGEGSNIKQGFFKRLLGRR